MAALRKSEEIYIKFVDLNVSVDSKEILKNVCGEINPGEVCAIMGPSGAGKSSLLNILAGRRTKGVVLNNGSITINGENYSKFHRRKIGYVTQEDIFFSNLTIRQSLEFVGKIRLPDSMKWDEKLTIVDKVIDDLGLRKCENTVLGGDFYTKGCSGGERKRCSIAVELITNPACIILDEPTTGLDSSTAFNLMNTLKNLAEKEKRAICLTIHQPSSQVFHMFDKLMLLCNGTVMFFGKNSYVLPFFESIGLPVYPNWNPADFFIEKLKKTEVQSKMVDGFKIFRNSMIQDEPVRSFVTENDTKCCNPDTILNAYENAASDQYQAVDNKMNNRTKETFKFSKFGNNKNKWPTSYRTQVLALWKRSFLQAKADVFNAVYFTQAVLVSLIGGLIWFNTPFDTNSRVDREGSIFFVMSYLFIDLVFDTIFSFPYEDKIIAKERAAGMYRLSAFYTVKNVVDLSVLIIPQSMVYTITYWMTGLNRSPIFLLGLLNVFLITALSQSVGLIVGGSVKNLQKCILCVVIISIGGLALGGFYIRRMPPWLSWSKYVSVYTYFYNVFIRMEFEYAQEVFECSAKSAYRECFSNNQSRITGPELLSYMDPIPLNISQTIAFLVLLTFVLRVVFYYVLKYCCKIK
ncbi:uncharacterized protein LOC105849169 isoform X1 [Hydra vulgaris]|uniref:uncharacterized protein LOC105849169 isoform X1 n=2 Tax=Hydra vulgaris TaxID=6087 RepID=UPI001F5E7752|nr:ABC transporter G family member 22 isoform X1 [Hydra vulgaris]XP_047128930.1 ABC transporter G family member 22 isoform X1 [Hydra vulgaris]XP_047128931.1 ABC transporter G family member 22 isoform X1 [Hydra vulgaris]XP_047128932.1 ABC transporter G family member 22 isoform X1 [Hydra vulgaris]